MVIGDTDLKKKSLFSQQHRLILSTYVVMYMMESHRAYTLFRLWFNMMFESIHIMVSGNDLDSLLVA